MTYIIILLIVFKDVWHGMLHHIVSTCQHGPLEDGSQTKEYLKKGSAAHNALRQIVMDKRHVKNIPYYLNCRYVNLLKDKIFPISLE